MSDQPKGESALAKVESLVVSDKLTGVVVDPSAREFTQRTHNIADMTDTYAHAQIEVARYTFAAPAKEASRRHYTSCALALALMGVAAWKLEGATLAWSLVGILAGVGGIQALGMPRNKKPE